MRLSGLNRGPPMSGQGTPVSGDEGLYVIICVNDVNNQKGPTADCRCIKL